MPAILSSDDPTPSSPVPDMYSYNDLVDLRNKLKINETHVIYIKDEQHWPAKYTGNTNGKKIKVIKMVPVPTIPGSVWKYSDDPAHTLQIKLDMITELIPKPKVYGHWYERQYTVSNIDKYWPAIN